MTITERQIESARLDLGRIAKENVIVEVIGSTIYAYCSEIASLRLLKTYRKADNADCGFSENLNTFYFSLETN